MNNIKLMRLKHNLLQGDIAKYLHINVNTYGKREKNPKDFTAWELKMLAEKFNCTIDYLLEDLKIED